MTAIACPLCGETAVVGVAALGKRYFDCGVCRLVHLAAEHRLSPEGERAHYLTHQNDPADARYRAFLERVATPLTRLLAPGASGLDYGCGPGPTLSVMLAERGFSVEVYDPFFAPDERVLERDYDFVTCTEALEHFHAPLRELERIARLLRPHGHLAVMTELLGDDMALDRWWYVRDPTHVSFYRTATLEWIAGRFGWSTRFADRSVSIFEI